MKQHAKRASWARVLLVPTLLLGSASMAAFPVHAAQVELNQTVTLQMRKVKLADVFKKLSNLSGYEFFYDESVVQKYNTIDIDLDNVSFDQALEQIRKQTSLQLSKVNNTIVVSLAKQVLASSGKVQASRHRVTGRVTDANNEPLIGVSIVIQGNSGGTITDIDGRYTLEEVDADATLVFSYIGYSTVEKKASECNGITIKLAEDSKLLQEVVVVGYGVQKKVNMSGSVSAIDGEQIAAKPSTDVLSALQGELPGVTITRSSGQPGSEAGLQVRGYSSVNATQTLVLIDGVEGSLSQVNAEDIASISVLKDAASCAIYGARAAAGVVLVTTKNGTEGKPKISYNGYASFNVPGNMPERIPSWEEQTFINNSRLDIGGPEWNAEKSSWVGNPNFNYRPLKNGRWDLFDSVDWLGEGTKNFTLQHNHSVSVSGGTDKVNYLLSANYFYKNGLLQYGPDDYDRYNLMAKMNAKINKYIELGINIQYQANNTSESSYGSENIFMLLYENRGRQPIMQPEAENYKNPYNGDLQLNPIDLMKNGGEKTVKKESYIGKAQLTIKDFIKNLRINLSASRRAGYASQEIKMRTLTWYN